MSGELASERWSPAQRVESVLISILSLLDDAEVSSPANVDASVMLRKDPEKYKEIVRGDVEKSRQDIPEDFVMPTHEDSMRKQHLQQQQRVDIDDEDFWADSGADDEDGDEEDVFGGSDSDEDLDDYDDEQDTATEEDEDEDEG